MSRIRVMAVVVPPQSQTTTCLSCDTAIPAGETWCSWPCRNLDDRHDTHDYDDEMGDE